jgi:hypothetical protein
MTKNNHSEYSKKIYSKVLDSVNGDDSIKEDVLKIGLVGSVNDNESVASWSDLDILFILKSDSLGNINTDILLKLRELNKNISSAFIDTEISFLTHTYNDLENYVSFGYLENYKFASFGLENDNVDFVEYIDGLIEKRGVTDQIRKRYAVYHLRHFRFNLIRKILLTENPKIAIKQIIDKIIETMILVSVYNGQNIKGKNARFSEIKKMITSEEVLKIYKESLEKRGVWSDIDFTEDDIALWLDNFVKIENYLLEQHKESTPEEFINLKE